jgi:hypothetical protein
MKRWKWVLLIFELVLVAAILILPQVDLPDCTFHGGTAPIAAKQRISTASTTATVTVGLAIPVAYPNAVELAVGTLGNGLSFPLRSSLSLFCVLIC